MVANFSHEQIELPKATILGLAEETPNSLVAAINDRETTNFSRGDRKRSRSDAVETDPLFEQYLQDKLGHLSQEEWAVVEPVLTKYRHVFHDFPGTDLVEHRNVTGDIKPIRKTPYRVPFALRKEMEDQVHDMLRKGVIEESTSPWNFPAILVPKKSQDGMPKFRFCVDFRALNAVTQFDSYPLPLLEESVSMLHGSKYLTVLIATQDFGRSKLLKKIR
jgi:hypothetical protein